MTTPLSSIQGLISGFNYQDLVTAIIAQARVPADRMEAEIARIKSKDTALTNYRGLLDTLRTAARTLRTGAALDSTTATTTVLAGTKALATVTTDVSAKSGSYTLTVQSLAKAEKLSSAEAAAADSITALGQSGTFTINGQTVTVAASDSLGALRDKINALNAGATPTGVSASILTVSPTDSRLLLTSNASGSAGIALADTSGTVLRNLGYLDVGGAKRVSATLVAGDDAHFKLDNVAMVRSSNVVSDAIEGVTLTLTSEEAGASMKIDVGRYAEAATTSMQKFVEAYNALVGFLKQQNTAGTTSNPALYGDALLRTVRSGLPALLLETVGGAASDLATAASAGISLTRDGTLSFDSAKFKTAFETRYEDLRTLFTEKLTATGADLSFTTSGGNAVAGARAVNITTAATKASLVTSGFAGVYDDGGTTDTLTFTDTFRNKSVDVVLTAGMTTDDVVDALQDAFDANGLALTATNDGGEVRLTQITYGSGAGITIATNGTGDGAAEAWSAAASAYGIDVTGTIGGEAATGNGQTLVGNSGTPQAGIAVQYAGTTTGAIGSVNLGLGSGARVERLLDTFLTTGGSLDSRTSTFDQRISSLEGRVSALDARLARRRAVLLATFLQMETAIARLKQQSSSLLSTTANSNSSN